MTNLTQLKEWIALTQHQKHIASSHMRDWFSEDSERISRFSQKLGGISLDYSRNRILDETIHLLCDLANAMALPNKIEALFSGQPINSTEKRPALHTALRDKNHTAITFKGEDIATLIASSKAKCRKFVSRLHQGDFKGATGKAIAHVVNVGIGGSYTGPMATSFALQEFNKTHLKFHFISSIDLAHIHDILQQIDPETTLFIIYSKSFSTLETLANMRFLLAFMRNHVGEKAIKHHFVAVTAKENLALKFGFDQENIFPLWDFIGGRYSIWSAIGLPLMLMIGNDGFDEFLEGAYEMDQHFRKANFKENMPVILALLGIWYLNFFNASAQAIIPYAHRLRYFIPYLQQADMESNGKSVNLQGDFLSYATSPILFGEEGIIGQHAYHQLLLQGKHLIPVDFIVVTHASLDANPKKMHALSKATNEHHHILLASALSQAEALMRGKTYQEAHQDLLSLHDASDCDAVKMLAHHQSIPGNKPSNILYLDHLTPKNLGALIALYEHKIFVQGVIWNINSFDQWGVELGKKLLPSLLKQLQNLSSDNLNPDSLSNFIKG